MDRRFRRQPRYDLVTVSAVINKWRLQVVCVLDFTVRVTNREMYVAPDRGAQGGALKTLVAMPYVLEGRIGRVRRADHQPGSSQDGPRGRPDC